MSSVPGLPTSPPPFNDNDQSSAFLDGLKNFTNGFTIGNFQVGRGISSSDGGLSIIDYAFIIGAVMIGVVMARGK